MEETFVQYGLAGLFIVSFLASTVLPLGSEWLLVALLVKGASPVPAVATATIGNFAGACTTYALGIWGGVYLTDRILRIDKERRDRAEQVFLRYGSGALLFSWLPVVGDPLCLVGGLLRVPFLRFAVLVAVGKLARYAALAWMVRQGARLVG